MVDTPNQQTQEPTFKVLNPITKSANDKREYKAIRLENDITALLISDPETDKSGVAMNVFVGCLEDPLERQGMAHYLEHMLFLGTKKYPNQSEYMDYLSLNGGLFNAYTDLMETNYFFEASNDAFEGGLDRFSRFFYEPLFTESCAEREMNAVNSEHLLYFKQDVWREFQLMRHTAKKGNPLNKFGVGSLETLKHDNIRNDLLKFYDRYYSSNQMKLVLQSNKSIAELETLVTKNFSAVQNKGVERPTYKELPYDSENLSRIMQIAPIQDTNKITYSWVLEHTLPYYKSNPLSYISHLAGHEGENSLLSFLKAEGLALELGSSQQNYMNLFSFFDIQIKLTPKGINNQNQVTHAVGAFLKSLRENGVQKWVFDEIQTVKKLKFDNADKQKIMNSVVSLSSKMQYFDIEDVIIQPYMMEEFNEELIHKFIQQFTADNLLIQVSSKSLESACDLQEPIYGTRYSSNKLSQEVIDAFNKPDISYKTSSKVIGLPPKNDFIPKSMKVLVDKNNTELVAALPQYPQQIKKNIWFKQDNTFFSPKGQITLHVNFRDGDISKNVQNAEHLKIWEQLLSHSTREISYLAEQAYIKQSLTVSQVGLRFTFNGFSDSLPVFVVQYLEQLVSFNALADKELFDNVLDENIKKIENYEKNPPFRQVSTDIDYLIRTGYATLAQKQAAVKSITFDSFAAFISQWLKNLRFEWLIVGNFDEQTALQTVENAQAVLDKLNAKPLEAHLTNDVRVYQFQQDQKVFWSRNLPDGDENSTCTRLYQQPGELTVRVMNKMELLCKYLGMPAFTQMRTVEQLGYVVATQVTHRSGVGFMLFLIQSAVKPPLGVSERITSFLNGIREKLLNISDDEYKTLIEGVKNTVKEKDIDIMAEADRYDEAIQMQYMFNRKQLRGEDIDSITKEEFLQFSEQFLYQQPRICEFYLVSTKHQEEQQKLVEELVKDKSNVFEPIFEKVHSKLPLFPNYYAKQE